MSQPPLAVLWLDDEFGTEREPRLSPWMRPLRALEGTGHVRLTTCNRIADFAVHLGSKIATEECTILPRHQLLILDVMLTEDKVENFESLGFEEERMFPLDAGAQVAGLLRSSLFEGERKPWLRAYCDVPLMLLSSSPTLRSLVTKKVGNGRMFKVELISKRIELDARGDRVVADPDFEAALRRQLGLLP